MKHVFKLIAFFFRLARDLSFPRSLLVLVLVLGLVTGGVNTGLLALINTALNRDAASTSLLLGFAGLCLLLPVARFASSGLMVYLTQQTQFDIRLKLCRRILGSPLRQLEELGPHRLLAILTRDIGTITSTLSNLPGVCVNAAVVLGCLVYLAWLSPVAIVGVLVFLGIGVVSYQTPILKGLAYMRAARSDYDQLFKHLRGLTEGTKELKLHGARQEAFVTDLVEDTAHSNLRNNLKGSLIYVAANAWGQLLFFLAIGLLLFGLPRVHLVDRQVLTGYTLTLLYMTAPLQALLATLPTFARANVAMERVERFRLSLGTSPAERISEQSAEEGSAAPAWRSLELRGVTHSYRREDGDDDFVLGPVDLRFSPGELVFVIGGNGSGKTTLAKLILGLYTPENGEVLLDAEPIGEEDLSRYRQLFSAVFQDGFLFEQLLGLGSVELDRRAEEYLHRLQLDRKVQVEDGRFSTVELSHGQRKRLALLTAYLEDRPFYLFDEWAADQDPLFKELFYRQLLPELRSRGKTVVVVSHDDRYYEVGERIVKLEHGKVLFDRDRDSTTPEELSAQTRNIQ